MTLAPIASYEIRGVKGPPGQLAATCSAVGCISRSQQRHHLWPKSYLRGQPYEWVHTPWGKIVQNSTGLCARHHEMVTTHHAAILVEGSHLMWAEREGEDWTIMGPLMPQPAIAGEHSADPLNHAALAAGESCPTCGYQKPVKRQEPLAPRATSIWGVTVPQDAELGAEVLDEWVDSFAVLLGFSEEKSRLKRYHVLAVVLAWAAQHKPLLIKDIIESQDRSRGGGTTSPTP